MTKASIQAIQDYAKRTNTTSIEKSNCMLTSYKGSEIEKGYDLFGLPALMTRILTDGKPNHLKIATIGVRRHHSLDVNLVQVDKATIPKIRRRTLDESLKPFVESFVDTNTFLKMSTVEKDTATAFMLWNQLIIGKIVDPDREHNSWVLKMLGVLYQTRTVLVAIYTLDESGMVFLTELCDVEELLATAVN